MIIVVFSNNKWLGITLFATEAAYCCVKSPVVTSNVSIFADKREISP